MRLRSILVGAALLVLVNVGFAVEFAGYSTYQATGTGLMESSTLDTLTSRTFPMQYAVGTGNIPKYGGAVITTILPNVVQVNTVGGEAAVDSGWVVLQGFYDSYWYNVFTIAKAPLPDTILTFLSVDSANHWEIFYADSLRAKFFYFDTAFNGNDTGTTAYSLVARLYKL